MDTESGKEKSRMDQKVHILALQKKTYASPRENMDAVRDMLAQYKREKPDFLLLQPSSSYNNCSQQMFYHNLYYYLNKLNYLVLR